MSAPLALSARPALKPSPWTVSYEQDGSRFPAPGAGGSRILRRRIPGHQTRLLRPLRRHGTQIPLEALRYWSVDCRKHMRPPRSQRAVSRRREKRRNDAAPRFYRRRRRARDGLAGRVGRLRPGFRSPARWSRAALSSARRSPAPGSPSTQFRCASRRRGCSRSDSITTRPSPRRSPRTSRDGTTETKAATPTLRNYEIQRINGLPEKFVSTARRRVSRASSAKAR